MSDKAGGILARLGTPAGASLSADMAAVKAAVDAISSGDLSVPSADSTDNVDVCDVVGNKTDAAQTTVGTTRSIIAYVKGLLGELAKVPKSDGSATWNATALAAITTQCTSSLNSYDPPTRAELTADIAVPSADATANTDMADVIGNKSDAAADDVATTKSLMAYLKGLVQELDQRKVGKIAVFNNSASSATDVVNISDKGVLTGISAQPDSGGNTASIVVTIDGSALTTYYPTAGSTSDMYYLGFNHRFNTSLRIQVTAPSANNIKVIVTYTIDN